MKFTSALLAVGLVSGASAFVAQPAHSGVDTALNARRRFDRYGGVSSSTPSDYNGYKYDRDYSGGRYYGRNTRPSDRRLNGRNGRGLYGQQPPSTSPSGASDYTESSSAASESFSSETSEKLYQKEYGRRTEAAALWERSMPTTVQGSSLRTWAFDDAYVERIQILMKTEGRPLNANLELWEGPDNTPQRIAVYIEDGNLRPFNCVIDTPRGYSSVACYNTAHLEFPLEAVVEPEARGSGLGPVHRRLVQNATPRIIQGGAIHTKTFSPRVGSVQILLQTDGRPLNARVELLQGPNNNKQVMEIYTEDGLERPFYAVLETPGSGNVVRIVNTATVEFPLTASVEPYEMEPGMADYRDRYGEYDGEWDKSNNSFFFLNR